jgi:rubrerythrin
MDNSQQSIVAVLTQAIQAETEGQHFYLMAAQTAQDAKGRRIFEQLAREELIHQNFLRAHLQSVQRTGKPDAAVKLGPQLDLSGASPIFSPEIRTRIKDAQYEMTALSIGIQLEMTAMTFYRTRGESVDDPAVRGFLLELADWESRHYSALLRQQEELKGDYWSGAGFAPF